MKKLLIPLVCLVLGGCGKIGYIETPTAKKTNVATTPGFTTSAQNASTAKAATPVGYPSYAKYSLDSAFLIPDTREGVFLVFDDQWADTQREYLYAPDVSKELLGAFRAKANGFYRVNAQLGLPSPKGGWRDGDLCELYLSKSDGTIWADQITRMRREDNGGCIVQVSTVIGLAKGESFKFGARAVPANRTYVMNKSYFTTMTVIKEGE